MVNVVLLVHVMQYLLVILVNVVLLPQAHSLLVQCICATAVNLL